MDKEKNIIASWQANANNWINIIETNGIESRRLATNKAILSAIQDLQPGNALDIGCGEGWLVDELAKNGVNVSGVDIIPELVQRTKEKVKGDFRVASYEDIWEKRVVFPVLFDAIVINFALIGKESTEQLLASLPALLSKNGRLFIQTLHPYSRKPHDYVSGWKEGSWDGLGDKFTQPYQWYFRTMEDWLDLLRHAGFPQTQATEVLHPTDSRPLSVIFMCTAG